MWFDSIGQIVESEKIIQDLGDPGFNVCIGTDSHSYGEVWLFATVICCHRPGLGGRFYTRRMKVPRANINNLPERLLHEAYLSIDAAQEFEEFCVKKPQIHLDVAKKGTSSARFHSNVSSYVSGMGFEVATKPDAWASSCVADRQAR